MTSVSESGSRYVLGAIIAAPIRSAATTQAVATSGSSAIIQPSTPQPATAIITSSPRVRPPSPKRIESTKMSMVTTAWTLAMIRLQDAPSAYCENVTTTASIPQMNHEGALAALPHALMVLAHAEFHLGDWTAARAHADEALELSSELDQQIMRIQLLIILGVLDGAEGRFDRARSRLEEAARLERAPRSDRRAPWPAGRAATSS